METKQQQKELTVKMNNFLKKRRNRAAQSRFDSTPWYIQRKDELFWLWWEKK